MKKYKWIAESNDGSFEDESTKDFTSKEECYNDMRDSALEKMKWNTEWEDVDDDDTLGYKVHFAKNKIIHESYSGIYTYQIVEINDMKTYYVDTDVTMSVHQWIDAECEKDAVRIALENIKRETHYYLRDSLFVGADVTDCFLDNE